MLLYSYMDPVLTLLYGLFLASAHAYFDTISYHEILYIIIFLYCYRHTSTFADVLSGVTPPVDPDSSLHCAPRKCRAITEMLTERVVLRAAPTDRVLLGAKNLLLKYTLCSLAHYVGIQKVLESRRPVGKGRSHHTKQLGGICHMGDCKN